MSWNIGYGALGQQADFYMDNGRSIRALSRDDIQVAANRITHTLSNGKWNVICIQENASASFLTRGVAVRQIIDLALSALRHFHWADLKAVFMPSGLKFDHGMSTYTAIQDMGCEIIKLPQGTSYFLGFLKKYYVGQLSRYAIGETGKDWVIINTHLSAYDEGGIVRTAQLKSLLKVAQREFAQGHFVIIAGDWNMRLCPTAFSHTTKPEYLHWLVDFPKSDLPQDWKIVVDPRTPTVRTLHRAYQKDQNYTTIVDGFVVSPNVRVETVQTTDFGFAFTDHQPVEGVFSSGA